MATRLRAQRLPRTDRVRGARNVCASGAIENRRGEGGAGSTECEVRRDPLLPGACSLRGVGGRKGFSYEQSHFGGREIGGKRRRCGSLPAGRRTTAPENKPISWKTGGPSAKCRVRNAERRNRRSGRPGTNCQLPIGLALVASPCCPKTYGFQGGCGSFRFGPFLSETFRFFPPLSAGSRLVPDPSGPFARGPPAPPLKTRL